MKLSKLLILSLQAIENEAEVSNNTRKGKELECSFEEKLLSTAKQTQHELCQNLDENEQLLELLWNQGPVVRSVSNNEESSQQLYTEEDEMATWLHQYQSDVDESKSGMTDFLSELVEPSCRDNNDDDKEKEDKEDDVRILKEVEMKFLNEATESVSKRDSVGCSVYMNCNKKKRKERAGKDIECHRVDVEVERGKKSKEVCQPASLRTRAAEVHNMSERRRRDRINEKMKTLQELIPRCNKTDKASMLDDAIEYLKSLQLRVKMMSSMQYNMGPMMLFPDTHRYMGYLGMGMPPGTMQQSMIPLGSMLPYPMMMAPPHANIQSQLNPLFHQGVGVSIPDSRTEASNNQSQISDPTAKASSSMMPMPNTADSCHHFAGFHYGQVPSQSPATVQPPAEPRHMRKVLKGQPQLRQKQYTIHIYLHSPLRAFPATYTFVVITTSMLMRKSKC